MPIVIVLLGQLGRFLVHPALSICVIGWRVFGVLGPMIITWSIHDHIEARTAAILALSWFLFLAPSSPLVLVSEAIIDLIIIVVPTLVVAIVPRSALFIFHP